MKKIFFGALLLSLVFTSFTKTDKRLDPIDLLMSQMTTKEKIGQMTQLNIDLICKGVLYNLQEPLAVDSLKLAKAIRDYGVGSILNAGNSHAHTLNTWHRIMKNIHDEVQKTKLKIPVLYGIDAIHGANYLMEGTLFPQPLAQAATFNPRLIQKGAEITAYETRAMGVPWNFSPVLDIARQPLWSRVFETYGEDSYLAAQMGASVIKGYQGNSTKIDNYHVSACMKHFLGYSFPFTGKDRTSVYIHPIQLREIFLPSFEKAIEEGALSVMINSGDLNGIPVHADKEILTGLLRNELGFQGVAVTDWEDIIKLVDFHHVAKDLKEAVKLAINSGIDMSMVPNDYHFSDLLLELVQEGEVPMDRIDEAVRRILTMKKKLGLFEHPLWFQKETYPLVASDSFSKMAELVAEEAITLLKNDKKTLPISSNANIGVMGNARDKLTMVNGAWSRTWQGVDSQWDDDTKNTFWKAVVAQNSRARKLNRTTEAKNVDAIVLFYGEKPSTEKPGDIHSLEAPKEWVKEVKELAKYQKPIVLVLSTNRPIIIREIEPYCSAILMSYLISENGTNAVAKILFGKTNPSGLLPITYPKYSASLLPYDHKYTDQLNVDFGRGAFDPQYEFGHGLSYSSFTYKNFNVSKDTFQKEDSILITYEVTNNSNWSALKTELVYVSDVVASVAPSVKRLRDFDKKEIGAGEKVTYQFNIPVSSLAFVNKNLQKEVEAGEFILHVGDWSKKIVVQ